jgi:hypothetical protein
MGGTQAPRLECVGFAIRLYKPSILRLQQSLYVHALALLDERTEQ